MNLVTTTLPGDRGVSRCEFCHLPMLVSPERLPRLRAGEDARLCDDCIADAVECAGRHRRREPLTAEHQAPRLLPVTRDHIDRGELLRLEAAHPYWHLRRAA